MRGRPQGSGNLKHPSRKSTVSAKISPELVELIEAERRLGETVSDTIMRMIRQHAYNSIAAQKKVDALEERLNRLDSLIISRDAINKQ